MRAVLKRLRPYGRIRPARQCLKAWLLGVRDGWAQPYELGSSTNVDHLCFLDAYESLDAGINLGQWLRSPLNHQQREDWR